MSEAADQGLPTADLADPKIVRPWIGLIVSNGSMGGGPEDVQTSVEKAAASCSSRVRPSLVPDTVEKIPPTLAILAAKPTTVQTLIESLPRRHDLGHRLLGSTIGDATWFVRVALIALTATRALFHPLPGHFPRSVDAAGQRTIGDERVSPPRHRDMTAPLHSQFCRCRPISCQD